MNIIDVLGGTHKMEEVLIPSAIRSTFVHTIADFFTNRGVILSLRNMAPRAMSVYVHTCTVVRTLMYIKLQSHF